MSDFAASSQFAALPRAGQILLLGGTEEAYHLAAKLADLRLNFTTSLAGRTAAPRLPKGAFRIGGFSAEGGLPAYIDRCAVRLIIDATHPYAVKISANAQAAALLSGIAYWRLERPLWQKQAGDIWHKAADEAAAAAALPRGARVFLALGRQYLAPFAQRPDCRFFARMIEPPADLPPLPNLRIILGRPQPQAAEEALFAGLKLNCLVCRNSGSGKAYGKLAAARALNLPVIMIERPQSALQAENRQFSDSESMLNFLLKSVQ